ncbi:ASCH domain-containing protein [Maledivibacter halophilus]|uniref:Uncharacterized protein YhfF n=1 Tax=Maledivibacter halophilus TaxID=36842 RepID=A0A1T5M338_9FIRM|nr:ASCH domain-containing protein [Maledivibacter halophilus]SKC82208.1 Uncharacterized protein YhfF [Maledivibacter halophilus]
MKNEHRSVQEMWMNYLKVIGEDRKSRNKEYTSWYFCDNEKDANHLAKLVVEGTKRATASLYYWYEVEKEKPPKKGDLSIITDWNGIAKCIIRTNKVSIIPFEEVTEEFARMEGEGDKSLEYWRNAHINFFSRELKDLGKKFSKDMTVVCEEFEVVYK